MASFCLASSTCSLSWFSVSQILFLSLFIFSTRFSLSFLSSKRNALIFSSSRSNSDLRSCSKDIFSLSWLVSCNSSSKASFVSLSPICSSFMRSCNFFIHSSRSTPWTCSFVRASLILSVLSSASSISLRNSSPRSISFLSFLVRSSIVFSFIAEWLRSISRRSLNSNTWFCSFSRFDFNSSRKSLCFAISFSRLLILLSFSDFSAADTSAVFFTSLSAWILISSRFFLLSLRLSSISLITRSCKSEFRSFSSATSASSRLMVPSASWMSACNLINDISFSFSSSSRQCIFSCSLSFAVSAFSSVASKWSILTSLFVKAAFNSSRSTSQGTRFTLSSSRLSLISQRMDENSMFFLNTSSNLSWSSSILLASSEKIVSKSSSKWDNCLLSSCSGMLRIIFVGLSGLPSAVSLSSAGASSPLNSWYLFLISPSSFFISSTKLSYSVDLLNKSSIFLSCLLFWFDCVLNSERIFLLVSSTAPTLALSSLMKELCEASLSLILFMETSGCPKRCESCEPGDMQCKCRLILSTFPLMSFTVFWYSSTLRFRSFVTSFLSVDRPFSDAKTASMVEARSRSLSTCTSKSLISFCPSSTFFAISSECWSCCIALFFIAWSWALSSSFLAKSLLLVSFNLEIRLSRSWTCFFSDLSRSRRSSTKFSNLSTSPSIYLRLLYL